MTLLSIGTSILTGLPNLQASILAAFQCELVVRLTAAFALLMRKTRTAATVIVAFDRERESSSKEITNDGVENARADSQ